MKCWKWMGLLAVGAVVGGAGTAVGREVEWDRFSMNGDLRLRHESIDQDDQDDTRHRARIRARLGISALVNDFTDMHLRLASGNDDPISSNQSLDDGLSTKDIRLDRAYVEMRSGETFTIWGGKTPLSFEGVKDLIWDTDLNPEGATLGYRSGPLFCSAAAWWVEERSSDPDTAMYGAQIGGDTEVGETVSILGGAGYYYWTNMAGFAPVFDDQDGFGNTLVNVGDPENPQEVYVNDYGVLELFARVGMDVGLPVSLYTDYILNTEAETEGDTGYMVGARLGKAKALGSFEVEYNYRDLEADATVAAYTDSDSFGGGTNGRGHKIIGKYQVAGNLQLGAALFLNALDPDGEDTDYTRVQIDLNAKF